MTIKVHINNFRRIERAFIEIAPVAFVVGENENGKSSLALATALTATSTPLPKSITKSNANLLVNKKAESAIATIDNEGAISQVTWPRAEFSQKGAGKPLYTTDYAVGLKSIFDLTRSDKASYFVNLLNATPTKQDLLSALPRSVSNEEIDEMWFQIEETGFEEIHANAKKKESELTGAWKQITSEQRWNMSKAKDWRPHDWEFDLERAEKAKLEQELEKLESDYKEALASDAISENEKKEIEINKSLIPELERRINDLKEVINEKYGYIEELEEELLEIRESDGNCCPCPSCGTQLLIKRHELEIAEEDLPNLANEEDIEKINSRVKLSKAEIKEYERELSEAEFTLKNYKQSQLKLENEAKSDAVDIESVTSSYKNAKKRLENFNKVNDAISIVDKVMRQKEIVKVLSQDGVRKDRLDEKIVEFNRDILSPLCELYGSEQVYLDNNLDIYRGKFHYSMLSRSAKFAVRTIIQIAIAKMDKSELLIIDDVDEINAKESRSCLFNLIVKSGIPTLVLMAKRPEEHAPDLEANGLGKTYLMKDGNIEPFNEEEVEFKEAAHA